MKSLDKKVGISHDNCGFMCPDEGYMFVYQNARWICLLLNITKNEEKELVLNEIMVPISADYKDTLKRAKGVLKELKKKYNLTPILDIPEESFCGFKYRRRLSKEDQKYLLS